MVAKSGAWVLSLLLTAAGAVLAWGVTVDAEGFDLNNIGMILFVIGIVGIVVSIAMTVYMSESDIDARRESPRDAETVTIVER